MKKEITTKSIHLNKIGYDIIGDSIDIIENSTGIKLTYSEYITMIVKKFHKAFEDIEVMHFNENRSILTKAEEDEILKGI